MGLFGWPRNTSSPPCSSSSRASQSRTKPFASSSFRDVTGMAGPLDRRRIVDVRRHGNHGPIVTARPGQGEEDFRRAVADDDLLRPARGSARPDGVDQFGAVGIGIMDQPLDGAAQDAAEALRRTQRIDAGAEIEDSVCGPARPGPPTLAGFRRVLSPCVHLNRSSGQRAKVNAGTISTISQTAPNVSPVAPPILR